MPLESKTETFYGAFESPIVFGLGLRDQAQGTLGLDQLAAALVHVNE